MSNYIEVKNDKSILINDSYKNVSFDYIRTTRFSHALGNVYNLDDIGDGSYTYYSSSNTLIGYLQVPADSLICFYCPSADFGFDITRVNGDKWLEIRVKNRAGGSAKDILNVDLVLYYFSFKTSNQKDGLQVMDANGQCIFNSNLKYLLVIDYILQKNDDDPNDLGTRNYNCNIALMVGCLEHRVGAKHAKDQYVYFPNHKSFGVYVYDDYVSSDSTSKEVYGCTSIVVINTDNY